MYESLQCGDDSAKHQEIRKHGKDKFREQLN